MRWPWKKQLAPVMPTARAVTAPTAKAVTAPTAKALADAVLQTAWSNYARNIEPLPAKRVRFTELDVDVTDFPHSYMAAVYKLDAAINGRAVVSWAVFEIEGRTIARLQVRTVLRPRTKLNGSAARNPYLTPQGRIRIRGRA